MVPRHLPITMACEMKPFLATAKRYFFTNQTASTLNDFVVCFVEPMRGMLPKNRLVSSTFECLVGKHLLLLLPDDSKLMPAGA